MNKPYWTYEYEAKRHRPSDHIGDIMTGKELVELGYNNAKIYMKDGSYLTAGYLDEDGTIQTYDIDLETLAKIKVEICDYDEDGDGYTIVKADEVGGEKWNF